MLRVNGGTVSFEDKNVDASVNVWLIRALDGSTVTVIEESLKNGIN